MVEGNRMAKLRKDSMLKHLLKPDHAAFLLIAPAILLGYIYAALAL